jgi:hypothetical protein
MPRNPGWCAGFLCFCPATGQREPVDLRSISADLLSMPLSPLRGLSVSRFCPTACAAGCILTPLPRLVDWWILVRLDRQISWFTAHILVQNLSQKKPSSWPKIQKTKGRNFSCLLDLWFLR